MRSATDKSGLALFPGASVQDAYRSDGCPIPEALATEAIRSFGDEDIDFSRYTSTEFYDREIERMWTRTWQWACREEHLSEPGDYTVYDVGPYSILLVRGQDNVVRGFHNACLHRGTRLRGADTAGSTRDIKCPYHGWTWTLDGALKTIPCRWDFPHVEPGNYRLPQVRVAMWAGFVFINMDANAPALEDYLEVAPEHFRRWRYEDRYVELHIQKELDCNWKAAQEAFTEVYHAGATHPQSVYPDHTQYDVFGDNVSRWITTNGVSSDTGMSESEILASMLTGGDAAEGADRLEVPQGKTARMVFAEMMRENCRKEGIDVDDYAITEIIDPIEYFIFPNMCVFPTVLVPLVYRFRPLGVSRSLMDILFVKLLPKDKPRPFPAEIVRLGSNDSFSKIPGFDPQLAFIYDQDTSNLKLQQQGFSITRKPGETLARYQEIMIRNFHSTLDKYI